MSNAKEPRDPRVDPKVGDVLSVNGVALQVQEVFPNGLTWAVNAGCWGTCMFKTWRKWAKGAEVIHAAD